MTGYIYFILARRANLVKIGYSASPQERFDNLQRSTGDDLDMLVVIPGTKAEERMLLGDFQRARVRGEWFKPTVRLMQTIATVRNEQSLQSFLADDSVTEDLRVVEPAPPEQAAEPTPLARRPQRVTGERVTSLRELVREGRL